MKTFAQPLMRGILLLLVGLMANSVMGAVVGTAVFGCSPETGAIVGNVVSLAGSMLGTPGGVLRAGVLTEIWTGEMSKAFRASAASLGWYDRIRSYDQYARHNVIHYTEIGGDPNVLVNNSTYPLGIKALEDTDKPVSLDKYDTEATPVTDDELHAVSYDKMASVLERHREALKARIREKAIHAIAPDSHVNNNAAVLRTTGETDTVTKRKRMTTKDIIALKAQFDAMGMPAGDRVLVLCSEHANDLLLTDKRFAEAYNINDTEGKITRLYGFDIYEYNSTPSYTKAGNKRGFGAESHADDRCASVGFHLPSMMKATGDLQFYHSEASKDPLYHRNLVNFRLWSIALPLKSKCTRGAIVSSVETE